MKILTGISMALFCAMVAMGCGDDGGEDGSSGSGSSGSGDTSSSSSGQSCSNDWGCVGGSCECTTSGAEGTACCDPDDCGDSSDNCDSVCTVCE